MRLTLLLSVLALFAAQAAAQVFDPVEFYGAAHFKAGESGAGALSATLKGRDLPPWLDLTSSGDGRANTRFLATDTGLLLQPNREHMSCESALDLGASRATLRINITELGKGARLSWHLRGLPHDDATPAEYLAELHFPKEGAAVLRLRVRGQQRFLEMPGASCELPGLELPQVLTVSFDGAELSAALAGKTVKGRAALPAGARLGVAASDGRARISDLAAEIAAFSPAWAQDAAVRMEARKALLRLREYAAMGLLSGVAAAAHPQQEACLAACSEAQRKAREQAIALAPSSRAARLRELAEQLPASSLAQHEAGVAALLAGHLNSALELLQRAHEAHGCALTDLALAECLRRLGRTNDADAALARARTRMTPQLQPECALLGARLQAAQGDLAGARAALAAAQQSYPRHQQLAAFADSARALCEGDALPASPEPGPLGLTVLSDLEPDALKTLLDALRPYLDKFELWLPQLKGRKLEGVLALFSGPVDYLNTALLAAGDNVDNVAGMYLQAGIGALPTVLACRAFGEDELLRTLVHELWHLCFAAAGKGATAPRWLNEGMAVYLSAGVLVQNTLHFDRLPAEFAAMQGELSRALTPEVLARAQAAGAAEFYLPADVRENYAAAWALVWYHATSDSGANELRKLLAGDAAAAERVRGGAAALAPKLDKSVGALVK
ncbi:MAG: hypothetical protein IT463_08255 [Planctomycetes bacterium]|nr:hypothetical protein [Planctomycetota bacterium]